MSNQNHTQKQKNVLKFIRHFELEHGTPPSLREIAAGLGISIGTVQAHLRLLQKKDSITWTPGKVRSLRLLDKSKLKLTTPVPLLGTVSAGEGITVYEEADPEIIEVPAHMTIFGFNHYCLLVSGNSMIDDGILDNDLILVRQQSYAQKDDTVIAILKGDFDEKATIKRYFPNGDRVELHPRNPKLSPIIVSHDQIEIRGKFIGLIRRGE